MTTNKARALSLKQADRCETAKETVCRCRCGGAFHGARRGEGISFFEGLPHDDPHYLTSAQDKIERKAEKRAVKSRATAERKQARKDAERAKALAAERQLEFSFESENDTDIGGESCHDENHQGLN